MRVVVNGKSSSSSSVISGVPQGSVLGPLLFLVYMNKIPRLLKCRVQLFVDESKVWRQIKSPDDQIELKKDLHTLQDWTVNWLLKLNLEKCKQLNVGPSTGNQYYIGEDTNTKNLQMVLEERD